MPKLGSSAWSTALQALCVRPGWTARQRRRLAIAVAGIAAPLLAHAFDAAPSTTPPVDAPGSPLVTMFAGSTPGGKRTVTLALQGGGATCHLETVSFADPTVEPPAGVTFPDGLVDFVATNCSRGSTVKLTLILSAPVPPTARFWRYGRTVADRSPHWDAMPSSIDANTVSYRITDGGSGDNDLSVNGTISARLGLGLGAVATPLAPGGLTASPGNGTVDLRWNLAPSATGYTIKRATTRDGPYVSVSTNQPGNVFKDKGRLNGTTYFYAISALGGGGESADSTPVQVTPLAPKQPTACGVEPMTVPRSIPCPPDMAGVIVEEEVYVCKDTQWQSTGWRVKESMCTMLEQGSAPITTF